MNRSLARGSGLWVRQRQGARWTRSLSNNRSVYVVSLDEHYESLTPTKEEQDAVERFKNAVEKDVEEGAQIDTKRAVDEYTLLVTSVREKLRLTIEWNDTSKLSEKEKVTATARRVGLSVPEFEKGKHQ